MISRRLTASRLVQINHGDTLQIIAAREMGDASKWADLIAINDLVSPYLTGDPEAAGPQVKLYGELLRVPAASARVDATTAPDEVFGIDLDLTNGELTAVDGDFAVLAGRPNLRQALMHRINTAWGELLFHLNYGCGVHRLKGKVNGPTSGLLAARYVKGALLSDGRVEAVPRAVATVVGDRISVDATANPITGAPVNITEAV